MTRTNTFTVLVASHRDPSEFIQEIREYQNVKIIDIKESVHIAHRCPYCKSGRIILKQNSKTKEYYGDCEFQNCPGNSKL